MNIHIFTDGACSGNPGPGGYGVVLKAEGYPAKELSQGYQKTTNNRMELLAIIKGLEAIKRPEAVIKIFTDSAYVVNSVNNNWVLGWEKKGFAGKKNPDLWMAYLKLHRKLKPTLVWIKGHNNHPENERCDRLAVAASQGTNLLKDEGYEKASEGLF